MGSLTVRIGKTAHQTLRELSEKTGEPMNSILERAIEEYRRRHFLELLNQAFSALRKDQEGWKQEEEERRAWDATLGDGLGDD